MDEIRTWSRLNAPSKNQQEDTNSPPTYRRGKIGPPKRKSQRGEPAADDVGFVSERIGWLPFTASLLGIGSHWYWVFCAIWIKPINLPATCKLFEVVVSKWPLD